MEFTKEQRHLIYIRAKKRFIENEWTGMCISIRLATYDITAYDIKNDIDMDRHLDLFPEFKKIKPKRYNCCNFWWKIGDRQKRLNNFDKLIKQTK